MMITIGIGSNIDSEKNMKKAAELLRETWTTIRFSSVYRSAPREKEDQPEFLNAVAMFESSDSPENIRSILNSIEKTLKKSIAERFGPRTIDLDLLLYGNNRIDTPDLIVPHPRMHERRFVLEPLAELLGTEFVIPGQEEDIKTLLQYVSTQECTKTPIDL